MASLTAKSKKGTVIHRTTSETLRLGEDSLSNHNQIRVPQNTSSRKKSQTTSPSCSFQITGVSLTRCDIGDDSADDLDESHTDDISRVTDNETPSFSEDSRDTDDPAQQYNAAITTVPQPQPAPKPEPETKWKEKETRDLNLGRFKVVKIESMVPFSRGRWTCFDYLDQTESSTKPSYVFCKKLGEDPPEILEMMKPHTCTTDSFVNQNYVDIGDRQKRIPNTSAFWETNCQESYLYSGAIIMPETSLFPINLARPPKNKVRSTCPSTPNIPMVRPIRSTRPFFTTSPSFDSVIRATQNDKNILINSCPVKSEVELNNQENVCKEVVTQDLNKNDGASVSCTATIDTKIEHALDVVKNHLTHAVRLEVEELKIKINELVDRISYLEYENDLLRANVAPDVLASLGSSGGK